MRTHPPHHRHRLPIASLAVLLGLLLACEDAAPPTNDGASAPASPTSQESSTLDESIPAPQPGDRNQALALLQQGQASQAATRLKEARRFMQQAVDADPSFLDARLGLGFLLLEPGPEQNQGEALRQFRTARVIDPNSAEAILGEGMSRQELGDPVAAEPLLREALQQPLEAIQREAPGRLALTRVLASSDRDAAPEFEKVLAIWQADRSPTNRTRALVPMAEWRAQQDRPDDAERLLREAVALDRTHVRAHYQLFRVLARHGDPDEAARYQRIHELLRQLTDHQSQSFMKNHELRVRLRRELVEAYPEHTRARFDLIRDLLEMRLYGDALKELAIQARAGGMTAEVLYLTARAKAGSGDVGGARQAHDQMRRMQPNAPAGVTRDILDEWQKNTGIDAAMYQATLNEWLRGNG